MQLQISGHNVEVTQALHDFVHEKMGHLKASIDRITNAHVILTVDKNRQMAEAELHLPGKAIFAEAEDIDMYVAIDGLMAKLSRQLNKYKEKREGHQD